MVTIGSSRPLVRGNRRKTNEMNLIQTIEAEQVEKFRGTKDIPDFQAGDTLRVGVRVVEGTRSRIQYFEGVVIARSNRGINSNFTMRKVSFGEGVERVFPLYGPNVESIELKRRGVVRRAKLYYLRGRSGKSARIAERRIVQRENAAQNEPGQSEPAQTKTSSPVPDADASAAEKQAAVEEIKSED